MTPIAVEYNNKHGGIYNPRPNETFQEFTERICKMETEQGRPITNLYGLKFVFGSCSPIFIGGLE